MKSNEFIQVINVTNYLSGKIKVTDIVLQVDTLRKLHVRLQSALEYLLVDPNSFDNENERTKIRNTALEIKEFANENFIQVNFEKLGTDYIEFSKRFRDEKKFASYWYKQTEITNLIVFIEKKRVKKVNEKIEAIRELNLENDFVVLDENGVNINKIDGVDL